MTDFVGYACWKDEQINAVINTEAIGLDRDVFLATHVPFNELHVRSQGFLSKSDAHEIEIFDDLMQRSSEERDVFTVVKGLAGSGKSHFIRWFYLQYRRQVLEEKETVVLIRRMDNNLRSTLEAILKLDIFPSDNPKITQMRSTLESASISLSERGIANSLRNSLQEIARSYRDEEIQLEQLELPYELKQAIPDFLSEPSVANFLIDSEGFRRVIPF